MPRSRPLPSSVGSTDAEPPAVLVTDEILASLVCALEDDYVVHRLWEIEDHRQFLATAGVSIRAVLTAGLSLPPTDFLDALPALELIGFTGTGYDRLDIDWARKKGLSVCFGQGANAVDVAEHAVGLILSSWRGIVRGNQVVKSGTWLPQNLPRMHNLRGRNVGIVGFGAIGSETAKRLAPFDVNIRWWGPSPKPEIVFPRAASLADLAVWSDILVLTGRADAGNVAMIDESVLRALGAGGLLVNVARGSLVNQSALVELLQSGALGSAALDVFEREPADAEPWSSLANVVVTPHTAGGTYEAASTMWAQLTRNLKLFFAGLEMETPLDLKRLRPGPKTRPDRAEQRSRPRSRIFLSHSLAPDTKEV